jgi:hypothetical protein
MVYLISRLRIYLYMWQLYGRRSKQAEAEGGVNRQKVEREEFLSE